MIVDITEPKSPLAIENMLRPYKRGEKEFTPRAAMEVLRSSNYKRSIRDMLDLILKESEEKQKGFKEVVLGTAERREQPEEIALKLKELSRIGGYEEDMKKAMGEKAGAFYFSAPTVKRGLALEQSYTIEGDFSGYDALVVKGGVGSFGSRCFNLPRRIIFKECEQGRAEFRECTFADDTEFVFSYDMSVDFYGAKNLPKELDCSCCSSVCLSYVAFEEGAEVKLMDGANLRLKRWRGCRKGLSLKNVHLWKLTKRIWAIWTSLVFGRERLFRLTGLTLNRMPMSISCRKPITASLIKPFFGMCFLMRGLRRWFLRTGHRLNFVMRYMVLPAVFDISRSDHVGLIDCTFNRDDEFVFKKGCDIRLEGLTSAPKRWNLEDAGSISAVRCKISRWSYGEEEDEIKTTEESIFGSEADFSSASAVRLIECLMPDKDVILKSGVRLYLDKVQNFHGDFMRCAEVYLNDTDLWHYKRLAFKKGCRATISGYCSMDNVNEEAWLPRVLDMSGCCEGSSIDVKSKTRAGVETLIVKDEAQFQSIAKKVPEKWKKKIAGDTGKSVARRLGGREER